MKVHAERKASQVRKVHQVHQERPAVQESRASADRLESLGEKGLTVFLVPLAPQASLGCAVPWENVERTVLSAHLVPTDAQVSRVPRDRMEIQEEKVPAVLVVYRDVAVHPVLSGNQVMLELRANEARQARKVTVDPWVPRVRPGPVALLGSRVLQVPRVPMETTAHQANQENTALVA